MRRRDAYLATAVAAISVLLNLVHTASHAGQHLMALPGWQLAYIAMVIYAAPVVAAVLLWTRHRLAGAWLLAASMAGSLVFGLLYHFVLPGGDNVFSQPPGPWRATAVLLAALQVAGTSIGLWVAQRYQGSPTDGAVKRPAGELAGSRRRPGSEPR